MMDARRAFTKYALVALAVLMMTGTTGCGSRTSGAVTSSSSVGSMAEVAPVPSQAPATTDQSKSALAPDATGSGSTDAAATVSTDRLIISSATMTIEVKSLDAGVSAVRALAAK